MLKPHHQAIIFDCDGTLVDSMPIHWIAWRETLVRHKLDHLFSHERFMSLGGVPATKIFGMLAEESGRELDGRAMMLEKYAIYYEHVHKAAAIEPVVAIARENKGKLPMAVATGSTGAGVLKTLGAVGMADFFDTVVSVDDVTNPKPDPETFLLAAERLGVDPKKCLAFEDAVPGLESARAAGMDVVDVNEMLAAGQLPEG